MSRESSMQDAKVEMNLTPRMLETGAGHKLPCYQVSAKLNCIGGGADNQGPAFSAKVGLELVYQQISGHPVDITEFTLHIIAGGFPDTSNSTSTQWMRLANRAYW